MNAIPYQAPGQEWDGSDQGTAELPGRPRRRLSGWRSAVVLALAIGAVGFYIGVRVEKGQLASSTGTVAASGAGAGAGAGAAGRAGAGTGAAARAGGFAGLARGGFANGNGTIGTVSSISGKTLFVTSPAGATIRVKLSSATKVTKSLGVSRSSVHPGDAVIVQGVKGSGGSVSATSVSDTGASSSGASGGSGGSTGTSGSSASSAVNSLFGGGGGG